MTKSAIDIDLILNSIAGKDVTSAELLEMTATGCSLEEARAHFEERAKIRKAADAIKGLPPDSWPTFDVRWDIDPSNFYRVYDGAGTKSVHTDELLVIPNVPLAVVDAALTPYWHRTASELWTVGDPDKAARAIVHWSDGGLMTPPLLIPTSDGKLAISGGNHRLAVARAKGVGYVPILSKSQKELQVREILKFQYRRVIELFQSTLNEFAAAPLPERSDRKDHVPTILRRN
jgi:hypothetical protein